MLSQMPQPAHRPLSTMSSRFLTFILVGSHRFQDALPNQQQFWSEKPGVDVSYQYLILVKNLTLEEGSPITKSIPGFISAETAISTDESGQNTAHL